MSVVEPGLDDVCSCGIRLQLSPSVMSTDEICDWMTKQTGDMFMARGGAAVGNFAYDVHAMGEIVSWSGLNEVRRDFAIESAQKAFMFSTDSGSGSKVSIGSKLYNIQGTHATLVRLDQLSGVEINGGSCAEGVIISADLINRALADFYHCAVPPDFEFNPQVDMSNSGTSCLISLIKSFKDVCVSSGAHVPSLVISRFEDVISTLLVANFQHSLSNKGSTTKVHHITPAQVKRAMDFARSNAAQPITSFHMSQAAGVSLRSLQANFQRFLGMTPVEYLKKVRLEGARRDLLGAPPGVKIADVARQWGFSHLGRFAMDYRASFGVSPTEDRSRARTGERCCIIP